MQRFINISRKRVSVATFTKSSYASSQPILPVSADLTKLLVCFQMVNFGGGLVAKSCPTLAIPWTVACQAPLSTGFYSKNTGVGFHFLLQGDLPDPGIEPRPLALQADSLPSELNGSSEMSQLNLL